MSERNERAHTAGRARAWWAWLRSRYLVADPRTVGLARIVVGALLCANCIRHWSVARLYYSNEGVLTNHFHLFRPSNDFNFSLFHAFSTMPEVHVAFALSFACYFLFAIGYRARLFSVLSCLWVTSMDQRLTLVENGGYVVVNLVTFWLMFLPTGQRFSVDSLRRSLAERKERTAAELDEPFRADWLTAPRVSLVAGIVVVNLAIVYVFNVVNKYGHVWQSGETVHNVLHIDRMVTGIAVFFREILPYPATRALSWSVLVVEALIAMLILWPNQRRVARPLAMLLMFALHGTFGVMMRLGPFSWFLIGWSTLLLQRTHWEALYDWCRARSREVTVLVDEQSGTSMALGRLLRRLDRCDRLRFAPMPGELDGRLMAARAADTEETTTGHEALWLALRSLPAGRYWVPLARIAAFGWFHPLWRALERRAASSLPSRARAVPPQPPSPFGLRAGGIVTGLREATLGWLLVCAVSQLVNENKSIPKILKHEQPLAMRATIGYPRIFQGWGMFSPNPVREDGIVAVEAWTIDGRRLDPFTGKEPDLDLSDARGLGLGQIEQDYFNRIRLDRHKVYRKPLVDFLTQWHRSTGRPEDELAGFDVYWLRDECPAPGALQPTNHERICLSSWRKRGHTPPPGTPRIPPKCTPKSAGR